MDRNRGINETAIEVPATYTVKEKSDPTYGVLNTENGWWKRRNEKITTTYKEDTITEKIGWLGHMERIWFRILNITVWKNKAIEL